MNNFIKLLQEIFMGTEDNSARVGLSSFRETSSSSVPAKPKKKNRPEELKLSELMKKSSY